jgi:uncharacterized protein YjdB
MFSMLASADVAPVLSVESQDPELAHWTQFREFIGWCKTEMNTAHFDMMACALYSDPGWKYVIDTLSAQTGVTVRASTDNTGAATQGGNWFLESHTGVNLKGVYFTELIEEYRGILYLSSYNIREYSTKGFATGSIQAWGHSSYGGSLSPGITGGVVSIYSTQSAFAALKTDGSVQVWGGTSDYGGSLSPGITGGVVAIYSNERAFAALKADGSIVTWGNSGYGGTDPGITGGVVAVYSNERAFAALKTDGSVVAWGDYYNGGYNPAQITGGAVAIYSTYGAFAALKSDGSVQVWGISGNGGSLSPGITGGVVSIYSTYYAFAALKTDGSVVAWGNSTYGGSLSPGITGGVVSIYSTEYAFAALKSDGSVVAWGNSSYGGSLSPGITGGVVSIYSTEYAFAALKSDGSVVAWGSPDYGGSLSPGITGGVVSIYSTTGAFAALKSDGSVVAWGGSDYGGSLSPGITGGVVSIYSTNRAFAALKSDGSVQVWGHSFYGGSLSPGITGGVVAVYSTSLAFAALKITTTTFDLSFSYYSNMDRYDILRKKENRRRVNLTTLNNNVFTLSAARDIQSFNPTMPTDKVLRVIVPTYVSSPHSITSTATIPSGAGSVIIACDEGEPVTISGVTYVNFGSYVYKRETNNTYTKLTTAQTISGAAYMMYGGDGVTSSGIALVAQYTFVVASPKVYGDASFAITTRPTTLSNGAITYTSSNPAVATIDSAGDWINIVSPGTATFIATQAADGSYASSTMTSNVLTVNKITPTLALVGVASTVSKYSSDAPFTVAASSASPGLITYTSSNTAVATVGLSTGLVTIVAIGTATITAAQASATLYSAASVTCTVNVGILKSISDPAFMLTPYETAVATVYGSTWSQIGSTLNGTSNELSFLSLALSKDGTVMAASTPRNNSDRGFVKVYKWDTTTSNWIQRGGTFLGISVGDLIGWNISLSSDGNIIAFTYAESTFNGVITASATTKGYTNVFYYDVNKVNPDTDINSTTFGPIGWSRLGASIYNEAIGDNPTAVKLSGNGKIIAIGCELNDGTSGSVETSDNRGNVRVYKYVASKTDAVTDQSSADFGPRGWTRMGADINGEFAGDKFGSVLDLSLDGTIFAAASKGSDAFPTVMGADANLGQVRVFYWNSTSSTWIQRGTPIYGQIGSIYDANVGFPNAIRLSADGNIIALAFENYWSFSGITKVMTWSTSLNDYMQMGQQIREYGDWASSSCDISLSSDGQIISVGTYNSNGGRGNVRVFKHTVRSTVLVSPAPSNMNAYPNDIGSTNNQWQYTFNIYRMTITGAVSGGTVYGAGTYRIDSNIAMAAVHAGVISSGETKEVYISMERAQSYYFGTTRNGVTSTSFQQTDSMPYDSYYFMTSPKYWIQIGNEVLGAATNEYLGGRMALSGDGTIIAIKSYSNPNGLLKTFSLSATGKFTYSSSNSSVAGVYGDIVVLNNPGSTTITTAQSASGANPATSSSYTLSVSGLTEFVVATPKVYGDASFAITTRPASTSNGAITYTSSNTAVATIDSSGDWINIVGVGSATFIASQAADGEYVASTMNSNVLTVNKITPTLALVGVAATVSKYSSDAPFTVAASSASPGLITYTSSNTAKATVGLTTGLVTLLAAGSVTITAAQAATALYSAPTSVTCAITVGAVESLANTTVTTSLANRNFTGASFANTVLTNISLAGATLTGVNFSGATITGADFTNANIASATNLPAFSTTQKLQLLRNANNAAISAVQITTLLSGTEVNAAITTPISDIAGATFVVKAPAYDASGVKVVTITSTDVSNNASIYIPMNSGETVKVNDVTYTFDGTNVLDSTSTIVAFITVLGKPFRLYAGSIIGLNVVDKMNNIKIASYGLYDILSEMLTPKN